MAQGFADLLYQLLRSRTAVFGTIGGSIALLAAAVVRLIPWWLFFLVLILLVVGVVAYGFVAQWWASRKDDRLLQGLDAQGMSDIGHQRVRDRDALKALHEKWKESVDTLRRSRVGRRRRALYFLPWYAIIGSPACGKSTAIKNSGLRFPMGEPKLSGTGGTRNCDWWFAEEAIILDTAGRYTFNDENEPDRDEWLAFLKLLRKNRPLAPLNGLIVAVAADGLLTKDRDEVNAEALNIRQKIDQIVRELGIQFPIYLLITKCDLIDGFTDFFGRLPRQRLDEMLGWTNPSWEMGDSRQLARDALAGLRTRALGMRTSFLWEEERPEVLRRVYLFPEELRAFSRSLEDFCDVLFRENRYNESPFLRGIYLTSGIQKGTAVSRMLERLGLPAQATELREDKKSYFLKDFFQTRLPADRSLVASTGRARGRLQVFHNLGFATIATVCVLVAVLTGGSYVANRTLLLDVEDEVRAAVGKQDRTPAQQIAALDRYVDALERLDDRNKRRPLTAGWGLYTGYKVIDPARRLFLTHFGDTMYGPAVENARRALRASDLQQGLPGLEALIRNCVLIKLLNGTQSDPPGPNDVLAAFWLGGSTPVTDELSRQYAQAYFAFLRWRDTTRASQETATDLALVRETLPTMLTADRVISWVDRLYPPVKAQEIPVPVAIANGAQVRGAFRPEAWNDRVAPLADVVDLLGSEIDLTLTDKFRRDYLARYFKEWHRFLLVPKDVTDSGTTIPTLLGEQSPYLALLDRTAAATALDLPDGVAPPWTKTLARLEGERASYLKHLDTLAQQLRAAQADPAAALQEAKDLFTARVRLATEAQTDGGPTDPFGKAERWVETTVAANTPDDPEDAQVRTRLSALLRAPVYEAFGSNLGTVGHEINRQWQHRVTNASEEELNGSKGILWTFYDEFLDPFLDRPNFTPKVRYTRHLPVSAELPSYLLANQKRYGLMHESGGGYRKYTIQFETVPTTDPSESNIRVTRTVLTVQCGEGDPWRLEHRQFRLKKTLQWSPESCARAELTVYVGRDDGEERALEPRAFDDKLGLVELLADARRQGDEFSWTLPGDVTATYIISVPNEVLALAGGGPTPPPNIMQ